MRLLLALLCCVTLADAQVPFYVRDSATVKSVPGLPAKEPFDTAHAYQKVKGPFVYIASEKDLYQVFGYVISTRFRDIDFGKFHVLGLQECRQCRQFCRHDKGSKACHRNRCALEWVWLLRDNEKAFTEIPSVTQEGHIGAPLPAGRESFFEDTVIYQPSETNRASWYTNGGGDCHARFKYAVFADKYFPVLLLKEWNYYGGCRAGGLWDFTITFTKPEGTRYYVKSTVLAER